MRTIIFLYVSLLIVIQINAQNSVLYPQLSARQITHGISVKNFTIMSGDSAMMHNVVIPHKQLQVSFKDISGFSTNASGEITPNISILMTSYGDTIMWSPAIYENPQSFNPEMLKSLKPGLTIDSIAESYDFLEVRYRLYDQNNPDLYNEVYFEMQYFGKSFDFVDNQLMSDEYYTQSINYSETNIPKGLRMFSTKPVEITERSVDVIGDEVFLTLQLKLKNLADTALFNDIERFYIADCKFEMFQFIDESKISKSMTDGTYNFKILVGKKNDLPDEIRILYDGFEKNQSLTVVVDNF